MGLTIESKSIDSLEVALAPNRNDVDESEVECFLQLNANFTSLKITNANLRFLKQVSENLQNLETLTIESLADDYLNYQSEPIHFKTVKNVTINTTRDDEIPDGIVFDEVLHLIMLIGRQTNTKWIEFIGKQNPNLINFTLQKSDLTQEEFTGLYGDKLKNLEESSITDESLIPRLTMDDMDNFISDKENLVKMHIMVRLKM